MIIRVCSFAAVVLAFTCSSSAAPLWHSIVLDDYSTGLASFQMQDFDGSAQTSNGAGVLGSGSSITNRRDAALFKSPVLSSDGRITSEITIGGDILTFTDDPNGNSGSDPVGSATGFVVQNDYGLGMTASDPLTGLDTGTPTQTISAGMSRFVIDLGDVTADFELTFTVFGDTVADYATATKTVGSGDTNGEVFFERTDFYSDLNGDFNNKLNDWTYWAPYVTSFAVTGSTTTSGGSIQFAEIYATIPEPGSMLAMAGLFGGAGLLGFRRRRSAKKIVEA